MSFYLDVGVVHIQTYLTRAPSLKGRRGASTMLSNATRAAREALPSGLTSNPEVGEVDGVVSTLLASHVGLRQFDDLATALCRPLRRALPAAQLRVQMWRGETYAGARETNTPLKEADWLPAVPEWPLAKPCDWCRSWPALGRADDDRAEHLCADCTQRAPAAGAARNPSRQPGPERDLLARSAFAGRVVPDDFDGLAALGRAGDATHVVTLWADGNGVGEYMRARGYPAGLSAEITKATWGAVEAMTRAIDAPSGPLPVIPHLVGGDDVLVSVPAHRMWPATTALLRAFGKAFGGRRAPSLSAGVVVHHRDHPLADVVELADILLKAAKRERPGEAALAWQSITHDGVEPTGRPPVTLEQLDELRTALGALGATSGTARQQLARLCRDRRAGDDATLAAHVARLGLADVVDPFESPDAIPLEDALGMIRWGML